VPFILQSQHRLTARHCGWFGGDGLGDATAEEAVTPQQENETVWQPDRAHSATRHSVHFDLNSIFIKISK
jgi:hypothetical protein